ncbi:MAG: DUF4912 domain-containing protein [Planctomycetales bacterium]|nr:DUF4912 domain-containing protein [Planctomycetales bacterium]
MTASTLKSYTAKDLAQMARNEGISGWHSMRKDELVAALIRASRTSSRKSKNRSEPSRNGAPPSPPVSAERRRVQQQILKLQQESAVRQNLSSASEGASEPQKDRLVVMVRDPYWLHVCWEITSSSVDRARSALGQDWHGSTPSLRLVRLEDDGGSELEKCIEIHGGVSNWYVDVSDPPSTYRVEIGYLALRGEFYCLARSNTVTTPLPGSAEVVDGNWSDVAENADRIFAMSGGYSADGASLELQEMLEERLRRRLGRPSDTRYGIASSPDSRGQALRLAVDSELIVYGSTDPHSHVTVSGEPVAVNSDGSFVVKLHFPDRRQVIPVVASTADGVEQKTVILGVERNTKLLDPVVKDVTSV